MSDPDNRPARAGFTRHPMLVGYLFGLLTGVAIALAVALYVNRIASPFVQQQTPAAQAAKSEAAATAAAVTRTAAQAGDTKAQLETILHQPSGPAPGAPKPPPVNATAPRTGRLYLQVGAFMSAADADNRKAKLALLGLQAMVRAVNVPDTGTLHRVVIGPFGDMAELNEAKDSLRENGYASSLLSRQAMAAGRAALGERKTETSE